MSKIQKETQDDQMANNKVVDMDDVLRRLRIWLNDKKESIHIDLDFEIADQNNKKKEAWLHGAHSCIEHIEAWLKKQEVGSQAVCSATAANIATNKSAVLAARKYIKGHLPGGSEIVAFLAGVYWAENQHTLQ